MKIVATMLVLVGCFLLILYATPRVLALRGHREVADMTPEKAQKLFESVGGLGEVNREAKMLFDRFGTSEGKFLYPEDLTNTPAISSLYSICENYSGKNYSGTSMAIYSASGRRLEIKFGNHWSLKWFYIFDPSANTAINLPSTNWFQVTSNIFSSR